MTNPLTSREAPDPMTLTGFSPKAQQELERNKFAAVTGGLVNVSARTYWELHYAAIAWHDHLRLMEPENLRIEEQAAALMLGGADAVREVRAKQKAALAAGGDAAQMDAEARSAILRWGYGRFADALTAASGALSPQAGDTQGGERDWRGNPGPNGTVLPGGDFGPNGTDAPSTGAKS